MSFANQLVVRDYFNNSVGQGYLLSKTRLNQCKMSLQIRFVWFIKQGTTNYWSSAKCSQDYLKISCYGDWTIKNCNCKYLNMCCSVTVFLEIVCTVLFFVLLIEFWNWFVLYH